MTILFTDLRKSTQLYQEIGDAPAFGLVMNHFDVLKVAIAEHGGAIVKTIGDAIMAVFRRPVAALQAALQAQRVLANPPNGMRPLFLKAGIHSGPCIAVTLNERLDYFGSTVNIAARLTSISDGEQIIISDVAQADPEVAALHSPAQRQAPEQAQNSQDGVVAPLHFESFQTEIRGFEGAQFKLWRVVG
jgi:class 3 adenylate cyclase